jgi:methionine synthase II (cobalamin-independent)
VTTSLQDDGPVTRATGIGSLPGTNSREAIVAVRDLLVDADGLGLPYLPELPSRGPGSDIIGRAAGLLVDMPVDLQPSGWRLVDHPGRDARRSASLWTEDLDEAAAAYDGYVGDLKVQICGPWTLAASVELNRGERVLTDEGAARDLTESLAEGIRGHLARVRRLIPGASLVLQLDEPSLPAVLEGELPTASGYGRVRAVDRQIVAAGLRSVLAATDGATVVHCCHDRVPIPLLRNVAPSAIALDVTAASPARWESLAATLEAGIDVYAGCLPSAPVTSAAAEVRKAVRGIRDGCERTGLGVDVLDRLTVTPACGLAGLTPKGAHDVHRVAVAVARELTEETQGAS